MRRRKPVVEKLAATIGFRPGTSLQTIIELTAASQPGRASVLASPNIL